MGRGNDNILGIFPRKSTTPTEEKPKAVSSGSSILFQPIKKQDNNLYSKSPTPAAFKRAERIAQDMKEGNYLPFLLVLEFGDLDFESYPAFQKMFQSLSGDEVSELLRSQKIPRRGKEAKAEREFLEQNSAKFLSIRMQKFLTATKDMPADEQAKGLGEISFIDDSFVSEIVLDSPFDGPAKKYYLNSLRKKGITTANSNSLRVLLESKSEEASDIFEELMRRESVKIFKSLAGRESMTPELEYGCLRISYRGKSVLHIKGPSLRTLCGSSESMWPGGGVVYGSWADAPYSDDFKQCPKCLKAADEETLLRLEAEGSDTLDPWLDDEERSKIEEIAKDPRLKRIVKKALVEENSTEAITEKVRSHMAMRVADVFSSASEKYRDGENFVRHPGGGHIAWEGVKPDVREKLRDLGYETPSRGYGASYFKRGEDTQDLLSEDVLLKGTTPEERRKYFRYKTRFLLEKDRDIKEKYQNQAETILNRGLRRFVRQEKRNGAGK